MKNSKSNNLEIDIMEKIKSGQVKLKSKYIFLAEKLGLGTAFTLSFVLSAIFFNLFLFYIKETDNIKYLSFGKEGLLAFFESFPYLLVVAYIISIVLISFIIKKSNALYKQSFNHVIISLIISITFFGAILTYANLGEKIEKESFRNNYQGRILKTLMHPPEIRENGIAGIVYQSGENYLIVKTGRGLININLKEVEQNNLKEPFLGKLIIGIGEKRENEFIAKEIKEMKKKDMPGVGRIIEYQVDSRIPKDGCKPPPNEIMHFLESEKECISNCNAKGKCIKECLRECIKKDR